MDVFFLYLFSFSLYLEGWKAKKKEREKHFVHKKYHRTCRQVELVMSWCEDVCEWDICYIWWSESHVIGKNMHLFIRGGKKTCRKAGLLTAQCWETQWHQKVCLSLGCMSWSVRWEEREAGKTACTAAIISHSFGREWQHFITCLSKCIIERVTSSTAAQACALNTGNTQANLFPMKSCQMGADWRASGELTILDSYSRCPLNTSLFFWGFFCLVPFFILWGMVQSILCQI